MEASRQAFDQGLGGGRVSDLPQLRGVVRGLCFVTRAFMPLLSAGLRRKPCKLETRGKSDTITPFSAIAIAILTTPSKRTDGLKRYGQRTGENVLLTFLAVINKFVFSFLWREKNARPLGRKLLALLQSADDFLALFVVHVSQSSLKV